MQITNTGRLPQSLFEKELKNIDYTLEGIVKKMNSDDDHFTKKYKNIILFGEYAPTFYIHLNYNYPQLNFIVNPKENNLSFDQKYLSTKLFLRESDFKY